MMPSLKVSLTIIIETALSVGAGGSAGVLADKPAIRNGQRQLILPGSHLKGRLRHACEEVARALGEPVCESPRAETMCPQDPAVPRPPCIICQIFGSPGYPSPLKFNDLVLKDPMPGEITRPGIGINRRLGTVEEKLLYFVETSPVGIGARFGAEEAIVGTIPREQHAKLLWLGLRLLRNWGGGRSRGLGWGVAEVTMWLDGQEVQPEAIPWSEEARA